MPDAPDHSVKPTCSVSSSKQDTAEVLVRNDNKINTDNAVRQRFRHTKIWLDSPSASIVKASSQSNESRRMTGLQRLLLKKITKRLSHQRSSVNPAKPVLVEGILVLGAVLLLGGILLVLLASGTGFAVGVIALAAGLVCLLIGLF
ncbi:MAG: hypothetical protein BGO59_21580 [Spirosoma sp. 48-14]|nr:MAG: hypothetical protein BGO59_21580 [Spirosoma sp. 48-14]